MTPQSKKMHKRINSVIGRMTAEQCTTALDTITSEGVTIFHPTIRAITGGYNSQTINFGVIRQLHDRRVRLGWKR